MSTKDSKPETVGEAFDKAFGLPKSPEPSPPPPPPEPEHKTPVGDAFDKYVGRLDKEK